MCKSRRPQIDTFTFQNNKRVDMGPHFLVSTFGAALLAKMAAKMAPKTHPQIDGLPWCFVVIEALRGPPAESLNYDKTPW